MSDSASLPGDAEADQIINLLGQALRELSGTHQITALAVRSGMSTQSIYNLRANKTQPSMRTACRLLSSLGFTFAFTRTPAQP